MDFLNEVKTLEDRDLLLSEIEAVKRKDLGSVREKYIDILSKLDLNDLTKKLKELEVVRIILAIQPTVGILEIIDNFFKKNLKQNVIIEFDIDKEIIGGMQIVYQGKYMDASVLEKVKERLQ